ncbi:MAG: hypothetical protein ABIH92_03390 [Nanoarchaeota archaeon]
MPLENLFKMIPEAALRWADGISTKLLTKVNITHKLEAIVRGIESLVRENSPVAVLDLRADPIERKKMLATAIYYGLRLKYGFDEALKTGNWTPWPHEAKTFSCQGRAIANYLVAKKCGLEPTIVDFTGIKLVGHPESEGHNVVVVNVGSLDNPTYWLIDQNYLQYGPAKITKKGMTVQNLDEKPERTARKDFGKRVFVFEDYRIVPEEDLIRDIESQRENPDTILYCGQMIDLPNIDRWQSEEPAEASWFLKLTPDFIGTPQTEIDSRILFSRPGIKSRGLEYKIVLEEFRVETRESYETRRKVADERVIGYYCNGRDWSEFREPTPMLNLPLDKIVHAAKDLDKIPLRDRQKFETDISKVREPNPAQKIIIDAARESYEALRRSEFSPIVEIFAAVEALYQHEKGDKESYLTERQRKDAIRRYRGQSILFRDYAMAPKHIERLRRTEASVRRLEREGDMDFDASTVEILSSLGLRDPSQIPEALKLLSPEQLEDPRMFTYLAIQSETEMLEHMLTHRPTYISDAIDRLVFYRSKIGKRDMNQIRKLANKTFGDEYEDQLFRGYVRIFAEFLGHFAVTKDQLLLKDYRAKILRKLKIDQ